MVRSISARFATRYCWLAGASDTLTGILLLVAPVRTLSWMFIPAPAADPIFLRYIGLFVAVVGLVYFYPWLWQSDSQRRARLAPVLEMTALVRTAVALFLAVAVTTGALPVPWMTILVFDATLAAAQLFILQHRGWHGPAQRPCPVPPTTRDR